jgi:hypothetical protein
MLFVAAGFGEGAETAISPVCPAKEMATNVRMNRRRIYVAMEIFIWG